MSDTCHNQAKVLLALLLGIYALYSRLYVYIACSVIPSSQLTMSLHVSKCFLTQLSTDIVTNWAC